MYYGEKEQEYNINEYCIRDKYKGLDRCAIESNCFDSTVKIDWGSIHYQKIAEQEYGKPIA